MNSPGGLEGDGERRCGSRLATGVCHSSLATCWPLQRSSNLSCILRRRAPTAPFDAQVATRLCFENFSQDVQAPGPTPARALEPDRRAGAPRVLHRHHRRALRRADASGLNPLSSDGPRTATKLLVDVALRVAQRLRDTSGKLKLHGQLVKAPQLDVARPDELAKKRFRPL